jgi:uncharacterized membrane protein YedE/YeeE
MMETEFTPISATVGGVLIGLSAVLLMAMIGRIAGISGIAGNLLLPRPAADWGWRLSFIIGLIAGPVVVALATGTPPPIQFPMGIVVMAVAGFLVGIGTMLGNGCTSGHGVCGIARRSARSLVATATFMGTAIVVVFLVRHVIGG